MKDTPEQVVVKFQVPSDHRHCFKHLVYFLLRTPTMPDKPSRTNRASLDDITEAGIVVFKTDAERFTRAVLSLWNLTHAEMPLPVTVEPKTERFPFRLGPNVVDMIKDKSDEIMRNETSPLEREQVVRAVANAVIALFSIERVNPDTQEEQPPPLCQRH